MSFIELSEKKREFFKIDIKLKIKILKFLKFMISII